MAAPEDIIASARALTDHDTDDQAGSDAQLLAWVNEDLAGLWRDVVNLIPTRFATTATFTISSGNSVDLVETPPDLDDFGQVYRLERLYGSTYRPLEVADPLDPENTAGLAFLERGTSVEIYPSTQAAGSYRLTYLPEVGTLAEDDEIGLPPGFEPILVNRLAARMRIREELEDRAPLHLQAADAAWQTYRKDLRRRYGSHVVPGLRRVRGYL